MGFAVASLTDFGGLVLAVLSLAGFLVSACFDDAGTEAACFGEGFGVGVLADASFAAGLLASAAAGVAIRADTNKRATTLEVDR